MSRKLIDTPLLYVCWHSGIFPKTYLAQFVGNPVAFVVLGLEISFPRWIAGGTSE